MTRKEKKEMMLKARDERLTYLSKRVEEGGQWALDQLKQTEPAFAEKMIAKYDDLQKKVENFLVSNLGGEKNLFFREGVRRQMDQLQSDLYGTSSSPLERLMVGRILICWLHALRADVIDPGESLQNASLVQETRDRTNRRFLRACRELAEVRKLLGPNIQVNVAEKINVLNAGIVTKGDTT
ncbi:MAG: hypothetical protein EXS64_15385 [Candidatus Latescibacteria bacterium]|nr:hypothetical protein [Candidatus Latescibacterota bacterium]